MATDESVEKVKCWHCNTRVKDSARLCDCCAACGMCCPILTAERKEPLPPSNGEHE